MKFRKGIFQRDSLNSCALNGSEIGFTLKVDSTTELKVSHLLFTDDLKLYPSMKSQIGSLLKRTEIFSEDIKMKFGLDKYRTQTLMKGRHSNGSFKLESGEVIPSMEQGELDEYLYLCFQQFIRT